MGESTDYFIKKNFEYLNRRKLVLQNNPEAFRPTDEVKEILKDFKDCGFKKTKLINESILLTIKYRSDPKLIMEELKKRYPNDWKYINRKKF